MEQFFQFASYNWYWFGLLALLVGLLIRHENGKAGPALGTRDAINLINRENAVVIDLRPKSDFKEGHLVDAVNIPYEKLNTSLSELDKYAGKPLLLVCKMGQHAGGVAKRIRAAGNDQVYRLGGGMMEWTGEQLPLVKGKK
mgnify:CR=1 FL=1